MMRTIIVCLVLLTWPTARAAAQGTLPSFVPLDGLARDLKALAPGGANETRRAEIAALLMEHTQELALFALGPAVYAPLVEEGRLDKQVGTSSASAGSTTLVSKGSVPSIIGVAVENGALYQSVSGNIVTFRLNPAGLARALAKGTYLLSGPPINASLIERGISQISVSASLDLQQGSSPGTFTGERSQLREATVRYDAINRRDPRHPSHAAAIRQLSGEMSGFVQTLTTYFEVLKKMPGYDDWRVKAAAALADLNVQDDATLAAALVRMGNEFTSTFASNPDLRRLARVLVEDITSYRQIRDTVFDVIDKSAVLTFEYAFNRLTIPENALAALPDDFDPPDTSTARAILSSPLGNAAEATLNGSATFFNRALPQTRGSLRDIQVAGSVDVRLPEIQRIGSLVLTIAAMGAFLHQQPFGVRVAVQDVETEDGTIGVVQTKLTIPAGASGAQIPVSFTYATRSEFNTEKEVRGSIGLTFDLDKLFSR